MKRPALALHTILAISFGALMSALVGAVLVLWMWSADGYELDLRQQLNQDVARHLAEHAVPLTPEGVDQGELSGMLMHVMSVNPALEVYILDGAGKILAFDAPPGHVKLDEVDLEPVRELLEGADRTVLGEDPRAPGRQQPISAWPLEQDSRLLGYVYVVVGGEEWRETSGPLRGSRRFEAFGAAALGSLLFGIVASVLLARRLTRPLRELRDAIGGDGRLSRRLLAADDEFGLLARSYALMSRRIREQVEKLERTDRNRREFVASVSHDLRTPLASLEGYIELLQEGEGLGADERREYLAIARRRLRHLAQLVARLFELAKLEAGDVQPVPEPFNLGELTQDVLQGMRHRAARRQVRLVCRMPRELPEIEGDIALLERALSNLVENAIKFTPAGGVVVVRLASAPPGVVWSIHDDGPGIPQDEIQQIFQRRFRGSGGRTAAGAGLGLAICRRVLELHGSEIEVESVEGEGCTFRFRLGAA